MYEGNLNDKVVEKALIQSKEKIDFKLDTKIIPLKTKLAYINEADLISYSQVKKILNYRNLDNAVATEQRLRALGYNTFVRTI